MRTTLAWHQLRWPREVRPEQVEQVFHLLAASGARPIIIEAVGSAGLVEHRLALPVSQATGLVEQLRAVIPGLAIELISTRPTLDVSRAVELRLSTSRRPLRTADPVSVNRAVLTALAQVRRDELLTLQWILGRALPPLAVSNQAPGLGRESWPAALLLAPFSAPLPADAELHTAIRAKQSEPGWQAIGRVGVSAASPGRARQLITQVVGALKAADGPGVSFGVRSTNPERVCMAAGGWRWPLRLNAGELATVAGWPVGVTSQLPVRTVASRLVAPSRAIPRNGRVIGVANFPGRERPVALSPTDGLRHLHVLGPTGSGKSTLLLNLITQDMAAGRAVVVIEPKGDLIDDVLARVPLSRVGDVVLFDPTDRERPVGLNPLALDGRSPELVADQLLGLFHALYAAHWGPRTQDILGAWPDASLSLGVREYELRWFVEVDRGTESLPTILRKCRLYAAYYQAGNEQATHGVFPRVCWLVPDEMRAERVQLAIRRDRQLPGGLFVVTAVERSVDAVCEVKV